MERLIELARGDGELGPVQPGVSVGLGLAVDQRADRVQREPRGRDAGEAVTAQHRLGVLVAAAPDVRVVGVDRLVGDEARKCARCQVIERSAPAGKAALQLARGGAFARGGDQLLALSFLAGMGGEPADRTLERSSAVSH